MWWRKCLTQISELVCVVMASVYLRFPHRFSLAPPSCKHVRRIQCTRCWLISWKCTLEFQILSRLSFVTRKKNLIIAHRCLAFNIDDNWTTQELIPTFGYLVQFLIFEHCIFCAKALESFSLQKKPLSVPYKHLFVHMYSLVRAERDEAFSPRPSDWNPEHYAGLSSVLNTLSSEM